MSFGATRRVVAALVAVSCFAFAIGEASAQVGWGTTPVLLSVPANTGEVIHTPKVDVDAAGNAVALWTDSGPTIFGTGSVVRTARFTASTGTWSTPVTLSNRERFAGALDVAVDGGGNAIAVWATNPVSTLDYLNVAEYRVATGLWHTLPGDTVNASARTVMNARGDGAVCWQASFSRSYCRRYTAATSTWSPSEPLGRSGVVDAVIDAAGNIQVLFESASSTAVDTVSTQRFNAGTTTWSPVTPLASGLPGPTPGATLAMNAGGDAVATWLRAGNVEAARYSTSSGWYASEVIAPGIPPLENAFARPVIDSAGAITVAWVHTNNLRASQILGLQAARYVNGAWTTGSELPGQTGSAYGPPAIDVDAAGNVHVVWSQSLASPGIRLLASRFAVAIGQWTTVTNLSALNQSAFNADAAVDSHGHAMAVWFQTASGLSVPQALRWTATLPAPVITVVMPSPGTVDVGVVANAFLTDPGLAPTNLEYSLDGGTTWITRAPASATSPLAISGLTDGVIYPLRLRAVNAAGPGASIVPTNVRSGVGTTPSDLRVVSRRGNTVTLAWKEPAAGIVPVEYFVEGGIDGRNEVLATVPTLGAATQVTLTVPDGAYFVRVVAGGAPLRLGTSAPLSIVVNTVPTPSTPQGLLGSTNGSTLALSWRNTWEGATPTAMQLSVSGALSASLALPVSESFSVANVPTGTYTFAVTAQNGGTASPPSGPVTLTFPGTCGGTPRPPSAFSASTQGGTVYLDWLPPSSGEAVTSYMVSVTGAFTGSFAMAARTLAAPVPPGSYTIQVAAVGPCGSSAPTAAQTVVVS